VIVRVATLQDAAAIAEIYAPIVHDTVISFETQAPDAAEMARRLTAILERWPWLVAERDGVVIGYAYASAHRDRAAYRWSADVTAYVAAEARRRGVGRALYRPLLAILRLQGFHAAFAGVAQPNPASVALHESVGFAPVGVYRRVGYKLGAWCDVAWFGLVLNTADGPPDEPRPFAQLAGATAIEEILS
jgi:phosphinothricin acetyltransferase